MKDKLLGISKQFESEFNPRYTSPRDFGPRVMGYLLGAGMEQLTTNNGDGTFTHELVSPDPEWPNIITDESGDT